MVSCFRSLQSWLQSVIAAVQTGWTRSPLRVALLTGLLVLVLGVPPAQAGLTDDHFDGGIFPLYAGNGFLVPPRFTLSESLKGDRPTLLLLYIDDSSDCKAYAPVISQVDAFYGRAANIIPVDIDALPSTPVTDPSDPAYYYKGLVPQTVVFDAAGTVVLNETGQVPFEALDDAFRKVFDLLPRSESMELKRRIVNEVNSEFVPSGS